MNSDRDVPCPRHFLHPHVVATPLVHVAAVEMQVVPFELVRVDRFQEDELPLGLLVPPNVQQVVGFVLPRAEVLHRVPRLARKRLHKVAVAHDDGERQLSDTAQLPDWEVDSECVAVDVAGGEDAAQLRVHISNVAVFLMEPTRLSVLSGLAGGVYTSADDKQQISGLGFPVQPHVGLAVAVVIRVAPGVCTRAFAADPVCLVLRVEQHCPCFRQVAHDVTGEVTPPVVTPASSLHQGDHQNPPYRHPTSSEGRQRESTFGYVPVGRDVSVDVGAAMASPAQGHICTRGARESRRKVT
mmetsp:Transcript_25771/g.72133  ORF Transcript_25771/g.72133 Transcript_25771/m.72133 type:complete len:298 (-) Transcript_25771:489-1382(-)